MFKNKVNVYVYIVKKKFFSWKQVDEKTRAQMFKLRQTWNNVFPQKILFILDTKVNKMDPAWPITAHPTIHVNPKFFNVVSTVVYCVNVVKP